MTTRQPLFPRRQTHPVADEHAVLNWAQNATLAQESAVITPENEAQLQQATLTLRELDQLAQGLQNKFSSFRT